MSLAASILNRWAPVIETLELRAASHGRFEVSLDGRRVFDAREAGALPEDGLVEAMLEADIGPALAWR